jgi:hypothetical protein
MLRRLYQGSICSAVFGVLAAIVVLWLRPFEGHRLDVLYHRVAFGILGQYVTIEAVAKWDHHEIVSGVQLIVIGFAIVSSGLWGMAVGRFKIRFLVPGIILGIITVAGYPIKREYLPNHLQFAPADSNLRNVRFNCVHELEGWNDVIVLETREPPLEAIRLIEKRSRERGYYTDNKGIRNILVADLELRDRIMPDWIKHLLTNQQPTTNDWFVIMECEPSYVYWYVWSGKGGTRIEAVGSSAL